MHKVFSKNNKQKITTLLHFYKPTLHFIQVFVHSITIRPINSLITRIKKYLFKNLVYYINHFIFAL